MNKNIQANSSMWLITMSLTGIGCTFMGPFLPLVSALWRLNDKESGWILSCVFLGSFAGTMLLGINLQRTLWLGAAMATSGMLLFAASVKIASGFVAGATALVVMGFGLGQLMSSINLLVGAAPMPFRSLNLAKLGSAWCIGGILSPLLATAALPSRLSPSTRLELFAPLFLLPVVVSWGRSLPCTENAREIGSFVAIRLRRLVPLWLTIFLFYGGIEASVAGWMSMFVLRYQTGSTNQAQWLMSVFWMGLVAGRILTAAVITRAGERLTLSLSIFASACVLAFLMTAHTTGVLFAGIGIAGVCLGPIFPLMLAGAIGCRFGSRIMGFLLAACGVGAVAFPSLLGIISTASTLRIAMFLPSAGLLILYLLRQQTVRWQPVLR